MSGGVGTLQRKKKGKKKAAKKAAKKAKKKAAKNGLSRIAGALEDTQGETKPGVIKITAPNMKTAQFGIVGTSPYVMNKFSAKALAKMREIQEAGSTAKKGSKREPKDFAALYDGCQHVSEDGWVGMPANGFRAALVSACRTVGFTMVLARLSLFVEGDGFDVTEGTPLIRFSKGKPRKVEHAVRIQQTTDIRVRAMWSPGWELRLRVRYDADLFTLEDVTNLLARVGEQVGVGEGRPDSKTSAGMGWGTFRINGVTALAS